MAIVIYNPVADEGLQLINDTSSLVAKATFEDNSLIKADTDNTPVVLTVAEQTLVGRITGGVIDDLSASTVRTLLNVADGANAYTLPTAAAATLGGIKVGTRLTITNGVLSADSQTANDFTTVLKNKLDGIAPSANAYVHPNHSGEVTSVADGATTIANSAVTLAKMANMATASLIYRKSAGDGVPEVNTLSTLKTDLALTGTNSGDVTLAGTPDYITISGQTITRAKLDIADDLNTFTSANLAGLLTDETGTDKVVFNTSPTFVTQITTPKVVGTASLVLLPTTDATTAIQIQDKDGNYLMNVDTTNDRFGFGLDAPTVFFHVSKSSDVSVTTGMFQVAPTFTAASATGTIYPVALSFNPTYDSAENYTGFMMGQYINTRTIGTGGGNVRAIDLVVSNTNTATIPSVRCIMIRPIINSGGGTVTDLYGIYIDDQSGISANAPFAMKTWGGQVQIINNTAGEYGLKVSKNVATSTLPPALIVQDSTTGVIHALEVQQDDVDQPFIKFTGGTIYTGKSAADEYIMVETSSGDRYVKLYT